MLAEYDETLFNVTLIVILIGFVLLAVGETVAALVTSLISLATGLGMVAAIRQLEGDASVLVSELKATTRVGLVLVAVVAGASVLNAVLSMTIAEPFTRVVLAVALSTVILASNYYQQMNNVALSADEIETVDWEE